MIKSKPYGIFEILEDSNSVSTSSLKHSLERLIEHIDDCRQGEKDGVWSWEEIVLSISNYVSIMQNELKKVRTKK
jgi:hypothetical protein